MTESESASVSVSAIDDGIVNYDEVAAGGDYRPFPYVIGGKRRELSWPIASTKRDMQTALNENRSTDLCRLIFGVDWPDVSIALDELGPAGDDAQTHLVLDYLDHIGVNEEATERWRANRQQKRDARRASGAGKRRR